MILKTFLEILMIVCGFVTLIGSIMGVREWWILRKIEELPLEALHVKKSVFCALVSDYYINHILTPNTPIPTLTIRYYSHKKWAGLYYSHTNECVIYLGSHQTIQQMIDTILHEMTHCSQNYQIKDFNRLYDDQLSKVGYFECKYEREARALSRLHGKACLLWVCQQLETN